MSFVSLTFDSWSASVIVVLYAILCYIGQHYNSTQLYNVNSTDVWGLCHQKQVSQAGISNCIPQYSVGCNYLLLPEIPASGDKVLICALVIGNGFSILTHWVPVMASEIWVNTGLGNGLLHGGTKSLPAWTGFSVKIFSVTLPGTNHILTHLQGQ